MFATVDYSAVPAVDRGHRPGPEPGVNERKDSFITEATDIKRTALRYAIQRELDGVVYPVNQNTEVAGFVDTAFRFR
jgi:hypothetical protein